MARIKVLRLIRVDEDEEDGARILARFAVQIGPVRLQNCELRSITKGRVVRLPLGTTLPNSCMRDLKNEASALQDFVAVHSRSFNVRFCISVRSCLLVLTVTI